MTEVVLLLVGTAVVAVLGIRIGMLLAPRFEHWGEPPDDDEARSSDHDER